MARIYRFSFTVVMSLIVTISIFSLLVLRIIWVRLLANHVQLEQSLLLHHPLCRDSLRIVSHEHVRKVGTVHNRLIVHIVLTLEFFERPDGCGEVGLVEVGKRESLGGVETNLVGSRRQV